MELLGADTNSDTKVESTNQEMEHEEEELEQEKEIMKEEIIVGINKLKRRIWETRIILRRRRGRPRIKWDENLQRILLRKRHTLQTAKTLAVNKKEWKKLVYGI
ncbi:hypothetical protein QE152_g40293 [Popillia japonica]|uniref:Uncharacterized protein n=1 Tax=Popillia japonica TaxID=7064 RepID=A0AAW1HRY7_POPJA